MLPSYGELMGNYIESYTGGCCRYIDSNKKEEIKETIKNILECSDDDMDIHADFIDMIFEYNNMELKEEKKKKNYDKRKNDEIKKLKKEIIELKKVIDKQHEELQEIKTKINNIIDGL